MQKQTLFSREQNLLQQKFTQAPEISFFERALNHHASSWLATRPQQRNIKMTQNLIELFLYQIES